ncbi:MAG: hypothetical protein ACFB02_01300 [Mastigocoleus sp.]
MARTNGTKSEVSTVESPTVESSPISKTEESKIEESKTEESKTEETTKTLDSPSKPEDKQDIDDILSSLKSLLSAVEKLQKIRQEVGDVKPLVLRMLDGELFEGEELEQLKTGVSGLNRLVKAYSDHQTALNKAQPARQMLDEVIK